MQNIFCEFEKTIISNPNKIALAFNNKFFTYQQCDEISAKAANTLLKLGLQKGDRKFDTVGLPLGNTKVRIVDENDHPIEEGKVGHIQVKGDNVFKGYWGKLDQQSEYFTSDGYFKTGDLGKFDEEGYLSIIGRSKDLIITGGLNVYPKEIELSLNSITGIRESAVIGVNHPDFGEAVVAVVSSSNRQLNEEDLITALKKNHAGFKCPKKIFFVDELPKNTMGKVQKNLLRVKYQNIF